MQNLISQTTWHQRFVHRWVQLYLQSPICHHGMHRDNCTIISLHVYMLVHTRIHTHTHTQLHVCTHEVMKEGGCLMWSLPSWAAIHHYVKSGSHCIYVCVLNWFFHENFSICCMMIVCLCVINVFLRNWVLSLLPNTYKIWCNIILSRLTPYGYEIAGDH
jgi:hypothetical protein